MTFDKFDGFQERLLLEVEHMKDTKGKEYAHSADRFANFNKLSGGLGIPNFQICWIYLYKHLDAIESYCKEGKTFSSESIRGRIVDAITYLTLLAGMIHEYENADHAHDFSDSSKYTKSVRKEINEIADAAELDERKNL